MLKVNCKNWWFDLQKHCYCCHAETCEIGLQPPKCQLQIDSLFEVVDRKEIKSDEPVFHAHERDNGDAYSHSHKGGGVPHGHHGSKYVKTEILGGI